MLTLTCCQGHILTENIWFVCSGTSYSGNEGRCHGCGTNKRTLEIKLLSRWKLEAESRKFRRCFYFQKKPWEHRRTSNHPDTILNSNPGIITSEIPTWAKVQMQELGSTSLSFLSNISIMWQWWPFKAVAYPKIRWSLGTHASPSSLTALSFQHSNFKTYAHAGACLYP